MVEALTTERLVLRRARLDDAEPMHRIMSNPVAMRYWSTLPHTSLEQTADWVRSMANPPAESDDFIITLDGAVIGKMGAWQLPDFGYLLDPAYWGLGYASEALVAFLAHRRRAGSRFLTADTDPRNQPSIRLLERHGFAETGRAEKTWLIGDEWFDSIYWRKEL
jgi:ribosomal-protein-alanine N-acetyltransferase